MGELLARASSRELAEWQAYEQEYGPLGPERGDWQSAVVAHTIATVNRDKKGRRFKVADFLLRWAPRRHQSPQDQLALMRALASRTEHGDDS